MLRLLIMIECDQCSEVLTSTPNTSSQLGIDWTEEIYALECAAEEHCWSIYRNQHVCHACVHSAMSAQRD
jgi:hypothetical protein